MAIYKYDEWGAAALALLGPFGFIINFIKGIYDHWESIKKAFQTDGIVGALKRIGQVLLDAFLKPLQQGLEMLSNFPGVGNIAGNWAGKIEKLRGDMNLIQPKTEKKEEGKKRRYWWVGAISIWWSFWGNSGRFFWQCRCRRFWRKW